MRTQEVGARHHLFVRIYLEQSYQYVEQGMGHGKYMSLGKTVNGHIRAQLKLY